MKHKETIPFVGKYGWLLTALLNGLLAMPLLAQLEIKKVEINAEQVILHYDLTDTTRQRTYSVFVYSSRDNFLAPLTKVTGDAGIEVKPGENRKIAWNAKEELGASFNGELELELRSRVYVPFIRFEGFQDVEVRKRVTPFAVKWTGGSRQNILNFQLYRKTTKGDRLVHIFDNVPNTHQYKIEIPRSVKPGSNYFFRISDTKNTDQVVITPTFNVRRKYPLAAKAVLAGGVGYLIYSLLGDTPEGNLDPAPGPPERN